MTVPDPLDTGNAGLYVHVPFCSAICPYCDFAVLTADAGRCRSYLTSLLAEMALHRGEWAFDTLYFGGGTPSSLGGELLERVLVIQAEQSLRSAESGYAAGSLSSLDLLDAERVLLDVRTGIERARADHAIALARLEGAIGAPLDVTEGASE